MGAPPYRKRFLTFLGLRKELARALPGRRVLRPALPRPHLRETAERRPEPCRRTRRRAASDRLTPCARPSDAAIAPRRTGVEPAVAATQWQDREVDPGQEERPLHRRPRHRAPTRSAPIVAEITDEGRLDVIGIGQTESKGLRKGVVINLEATVDSIKRVVEEAELMAGVEIGSAYVGIAGTHIRGFNSRGVIAVSSKNRVDRARGRRAARIEAAKAVSIPMDREILHVLPQEFVVDDQDGIGDPTGMTGTRLEVNVHVITCSSDRGAEHRHLREPRRARGDRTPCSRSSRRPRPA